MKNVLITGSRGFLGKSVCILFKDAYTIFELSKPDTVNSIRLDMEVPAFSQVFDMVVHSAGLAHSIPNNEIDRNRFFEVNVKGTENLLKGLALVGVPKQFVFISSVAVYGLDNGNRINENSPLLAMDPYGLSKIQAERIVINWCNKNKVVCTILRLPLLVGKNPPGNLGAMCKAIKNGFYFNIGGGIAKKSMVLAEDVAQFIPIIAPVGGTYNLTDGEHPSFSSLSYAIAKNRMKNLPLIVAKMLGSIGDIFGVKAPLNSLKVKKIVSNLTFDDSKARSLGWKPQSVIEYLKENDL